MGMFNGMFTKKEPSFFMQQENWNSFKKNIRISQDNKDITELLKNKMPISRNQMFNNVFSGIEYYPTLKNVVNTIKTKNPGWEKLKNSEKYKMYKKSFQDKFKYGFVEYILKQALRDIMLKIEKRGDVKNIVKNPKIEVFDGTRWINFNEVSNGKKFSKALNEKARKNRNEAEKNLQKEREEQKRRAEREEQKRRAEQASLNKTKSNALKQGSAGVPNNGGTTILAAAAAGVKHGAYLR